MYHFVGIDLIQGVNWLSKNHAMIDFKEKMCIFPWKMEMR